MIVSENIIKMWEEEGWKFNQTETGFNFTTSFPVDKFTRIITVFFESKPRNYYYVEVKLTNNEKNQYAYDYLNIEPKEHMMIHKTILDLGWLENE